MPDHVSATRSPSASEHVRRDRCHRRRRVDPDRYTLAARRSGRGPYGDGTVSGAAPASSAPKLSCRPLAPPHVITDTTLSTVEADADRAHAGSNWPSATSKRAPARALPVWTVHANGAWAGWPPSPTTCCAGCTSFGTNIGGPIVAKTMRRKLLTLPGRSPAAGAASNSTSRPAGHGETSPRRPRPTTRRLAALLNIAPREPRPTAAAATTGHRAPTLTSHAHTSITAASNASTPPVSPQPHPRAARRSPDGQ